MRPSSKCLILISYRVAYMYALYRILPKILVGLWKWVGAYWSNADRGNGWGMSQRIADSPDNFCGEVEPIELGVGERPKRLVIGRSFRAVEI